MQELTEQLRAKAKELLEGGSVDVVIGYGPTGGGGEMSAVFVRHPQQVGKLEFNDRCGRNLAVYLNKPEVRALGKCALVVKGCDRRAVNVLLREQRLRREQLYLIGINCEGVGQPRARKCDFCSAHNPEGCDTVLGEPVAATPGDGEYRDVEEMESRSLEERWAFWRDKLGDCVRCYACRQVCPLCYCQRCAVEKNIPQWVDTSAHLRGNLGWNLMRAFHLAGRCVGCGECERVCPMDIPLGLLNQKLAKLVQERFGFVSGHSPDESAPFSTYDLGIDTDEGIL